MLDIKINSQTKINPLGKEIFYPGTKDHCILLIHGYTGLPAEMKYLGERINILTGFSVYIPRLPGHGTNTTDFRHSTAHGWLRKTYDSYLHLDCEYENIYVIGLSMGGLLALLTASKFNVKKLVTISAALHTKNPFVPLTPILKYILPRIKQQSESDYDSEAEKKYQKNYLKYHYPGQIAELYKLMLLTRKKLNQVETDTLIIASRADELVPLKSAHLIYEDINSDIKKIQIYEESPHVIIDGPEKKECTRKIINFLLYF